LAAYPLKSGFNSPIISLNLYGAKHIADGLYNFGKYTWAKILIYSKDNL
jgi:hypothetical protein